MSEGSIDFIRQLQNRPQVDGSRIRPAQAAVSPSGQLLDIPMSPDHPNWRSQMPKPEPMDEPPAQSGLILPPSVSAQPAAPQGAKRVAIYYGRGDDFILAIEVAPDWDADLKIKASAEQVKLAWVLAAALDVKVKNTTMEDFNG